MDDMDDMDNLDAVALFANTGRSAALSDGAFLAGRTSHVGSRRQPLLWATGYGTVEGADEKKFRPFDKLKTG